MIWRAELIVMFLSFDFRSGLPEMSDFLANLLDVFVAVVKVDVADRGEDGAVVGRLEVGLAVEGPVAVPAIRVEEELDCQKNSIFKFC